MTIVHPEPEEEGNENRDLLGAKLEVIASHLITALGLGTEHLDRRAEMSDLLADMRGSEDDDATLLAIDALSSTLEAIRVLGRDWMMSETTSYCIEADPPSPYFRLGDVETCSHRPDHPR